MTTYYSDCAAIFSRSAVVCMVLGFVALLSMVILAIYKTNESKQLIRKTMEGLFLSMSNLQSNVEYHVLSNLFLKPFVASPVKVLRSL